MINSFIGDLFDSLINLISSTGYPGVFLVILIEYSCFFFPIPSEVTLPFIGYLASIKSISLLGAIVISSLAGITGSLICYYIGYFGGNPVLHFISKKYKSTMKPINYSKQWFTRYGKFSILLGRLLPVVKSFISFPAGIAKMNIFIFILYSSIGIALWNTILISLGYFLGSNWRVVEDFIGEYKLIVGVIFLILLITLIYIKFIKKKRSSTNTFDS